MGTGGARSRFEAEKKGRGFFWWFLLGGGEGRRTRGGTTYPKMFSRRRRTWPMNRAPRQPLYGISSEWQR